MTQIRTLFARNVDRSINGVIKADQDDHLATEVSDYVITNEVNKHLGPFLEQYLEGGDDNGVWISGFFGSGKSHLLKMLSLLLPDREIGGKTVTSQFAGKTDDQFLIGNIEAISRIPSQSILFNIDQKFDNSGGADNNRLVAVFMKVLNEMQGYYPKQGYVAEFEHRLTKRGEYEAFKTLFDEMAGMPWANALDTIDNIDNDIFAKVYAKFNNTTEEEGLRYFDRARDSYRPSVEDLAERVNEYLATKSPDFRLNFFVDEVGQFIGKDSKLMLNLQTIVETLSTKCKGRSWVFVTSQGDLQAILGALREEEGADFSKIMGRFKTKPNLSSADVAEVIQKRLLAKTEAEPAPLKTLYEEERANLKTLLTFQDDSRRYAQYRHTQDFCDFYPFQPYQFTLFQTAIERLSQHDAFTGKHASVGERSMLAVFQVVAKQIANREVGAFATFDLMFEGIKDVLKSEFQRSVLTAERELQDDQPTAVQILKCLFLLKWVTEFKPTVSNVAILLIDRADIKIAHHKEEVQKALNYLENQSYLQRNGDLYEFLTDEEKDIEVEIKNTEIDESAVSKLLADVLFSDILGDQRIRYDANHHDYPYTRKLDGALSGRPQDLAVNIITPSHPNAGDENSLIRQNTGTRELAVLLPVDARFLADARLYKKTERYTQQAQSTALSSSRQAILRERGTLNSKRRTSLKETCTDLLTKARFVVNGTTLEVTGSEPKARLSKAFQTLISVTYPNLRMLTAPYTEAKVREILTEEDSLAAAGESLGDGEQEILAYLKRAKMGKERVEVSDIVQKFSTGQHGWYEMATLCLLARLFRRHKIEFRENTTILDSHELIPYLTNTQKQGALTIELQEEFDQSAINRLKSFHSEFFDTSNPGTDAKSAANSLLEAFQKQVSVLDPLLAKSETFPFVNQLQAIRDRIAGISDKDYTFVLKNLHDFEDDLLEAREAYLDPIKSFVNGANGSLYLEICHFLRDQTGNLDPADERSKTLHDLQQSERPFADGRLPRSKAVYSALKGEIAEKVDAARQSALGELTRRRDQLLALDGADELDSADLQRVQAPLDAATGRIAAASLIPVIQSIVRGYADNDFPNQLSTLQALIVAANAPTSIVSERNLTKPTLPTPAETYTSLSAVLRDFRYDQAVLETEADIESYLAALGSHLKSTLKDKPGITL
ncbi:MAG: energy-coupling factor transporter ATP-binding protein EcfA2 [Akkermansiaceae bacterium]|jgi:energy-coupling factor transporter ATP-binding protein EcfA2